MAPFLWAILVLTSGVMATTPNNVAPERSDPTTIFCYDESLTTFAKALKPSEYPHLADRMHNGRKLTINILDLSYEIDMNDAYYTAKEWAKISESNVCYVMYNGNKERKSIFKMKMFADLSAGKKMFKDEGVGMVANDIKKFIDLVKPSSMKDVTIVGFGMGAHIGSQLCKDLKGDQKVAKFIALNPLRPWHDEKFTYKDDADYVQVIHSSKRMGTKHACGHVDIWIDLDASWLKKLNLALSPKLHNLAYLLHEQIVKDKLCIVADKGYFMWEYIYKSGEKSFTCRNEKTDKIGCVVGVYGDGEGCKPNEEMTIGKEQLDKFLNAKYNLKL